MAAIKPIIYLFTILVSLAIVFSQDTNPTTPDESDGSTTEGEGQEHEDRLFFSLSRLTTCNYTAEAGSTCRSCRTALTCLSSGVGILRICHGFLPYCNSGHCSFYAGSACSSSNSTS